MPCFGEKTYLEHHNTVGAHLYWNICKEFGIDIYEKWYKHSSVIDTPNLTLIRDTQFETVRSLCTIINEAIPSD